MAFLECKRHFPLCAQRTGGVRVMGHGMPHPLQSRGWPGQGLAQQQATFVKKHFKVLVSELAPSRLDSWSLRLRLVQGQLQPDPRGGAPRDGPRGGKQAEKAASRRAAPFPQDFNLVEVFSGFCLIFVVHLRLIPSSEAGRASVVSQQLVREGHIKYLQPVHSP